MTLAIFDLDNTLIAGDSDHLWGEFLIDQGIDKAKTFAEMIEAEPDFELVTRPELNILTYRYCPEDVRQALAMADELQFIGADPFSGAAGDVRFKNNTLSVDIDGDQSADFAVELPGVKSLKGSNLIL